MSNELVQLLLEAAAVIVADYHTVDALPEPFHQNSEAYLQNLNDRLESAAASLEAQEPVQRKWSGLLVGSDSGLIGPYGTTWEGHPEHYERITLTEYRHPPTNVVPEGWKLVPVEPDYTMIKAADERLTGKSGVCSIADAYQAMLAAAPQQGGE